MEYLKDIERALAVLAEEGVILYPTDTIWGLGCDAASEKGIASIRKIKRRPAGSSMVVLVSKTDMMREYISELPETALDLINRYKKPLTLVLPARRGLLSPSLLSPDGYLGIRVTSDPFCVTLIEKFGRPVVSTSANISGNPPPELFDDIEKYIIESADYTVMHRRDDRERSLPSAIIRIDRSGDISILRQ